jgi:PHD/YefM family antitoxin component YafN of YafNO toxin-antitoxin module
MGFKIAGIHSISDFTRNARSHVDRLRETRRPEVLTLNGAAELVVQNAEAYQEMVDRVDELETLLALDEAAAELERGEGVDATEMLSRLRKRLGVRQRAR